MMMNKIIGRKRSFIAVMILLLFTQASSGQLVISSVNPLQQKDTALRNEVLKWSKSRAIPNKLHAAHPSSINFPGAVKSGFEVKKFTYHFVHNQADPTQIKTYKKFAFSNPNAMTLYSTGLYAPPGQAVRVTLPAVLQNANLYLFIGAHSDDLGDGEAAHEDWRRMPAVNSGYILDSSFQFASSPFGGLIYLAIAPDEPSKNAEVTFENVISALYYKQGVTSFAQWKEQLKANKAPWGEIASDKVIITLPDTTLQKIENPEELVRIWDKILTTEFELSQLPCPFIRPMRMVLDEQVSVGGMHSGYPIMIMNSPSVYHDSESEEVVINPQKLLTPSEGRANWGFFHEIGHNLQNWEWVFDGTTEVGCNFYSLYVFDQLLKTRKGAHIAIKDSTQKKLMQHFLANGATYAAYQQEPFLGLIPFMQLQKQFGWEPFKKVFRWYLDYYSYDYQMWYNDNQEKANIFKINRFVERFSIITRRNLVPFFQTWGIPVDTSIQERLTGFKTWYPHEIKPFVRTNK